MKVDAPATEDLAGLLSPEALAEAENQGDTNALMALLQARTEMLDYVDPSVFHEESLLPELTQPKTEEEVKAQLSEDKGKVREQ